MAQGTCLCRERFSLFSSPERARDRFLFNRTTNAIVLITKKKNRTNSISKDVFGAPSVKRIVLRTTFQRQTRRFQNVLGVPLRQRFGRCFVRSAHVVLGAYAVRCSWLVRSFTIVHGVSSANALSVESDFRRTIGNRKTRFLSIIDHRDRRRVARTALN